MNHMHRTHLLQMINVKRHGPGARPHVSSAAKLQANYSSVKLCNVALKKNARSVVLRFTDLLCHSLPKQSGSLVSGRSLHLDATSSAKEVSRQVFANSGLPLGLWKD